MKSFEEEWERFKAMSAAEKVERNYKNAKEVAVVVTAGVIITHSVFEILPGHLQAKAREAIIAQVEFEINSYVESLRAGGKL